MNWLQELAKLSVRFFPNSLSSPSTSTGCWKPALRGRSNPESILSEDAIDLLATKLRTPLQIQLHLSMALEAGYLTGEKPVSAELVESVLSRQLDDLEPTLTRHGYRIKDLVDQFDARPNEIKALFSNALDPARAAELRDKMLAAGLPI